MKTKTTQEAQISALTEQVGSLKALLKKGVQKTRYYSHLEMVTKGEKFNVIPIKCHDVVTVTSTQDFEEPIRELDKKLNEHLKMDVTLMGLSPEDKMESMSQAQMNACGWYHADQIPKDLVEKIKSEAGKDPKVENKEEESESESEEVQKKPSKIRGFLGKLRGSKKPEIETEEEEKEEEDSENPF